MVKPKQTEAVRSFLYRYPLLFFLSLIICYSTDKFQIFYCFTGLAYIDVKNLREKHIHISFDGNLWIMTKRQKTDVNSNIPLLDVAKQILEKYKGTLPNEMVLPVLSNQKMNSYLKKIRDLCGIEKNLTFHLAQHTMATTIALSNGMPMESLAKLLEHKNVRTTQLYARITDTKLNADMESLEEKLADFRF